MRETFYIDLFDYIDKPLASLPPLPDEKDLYYRADGECCEQIPECQCGDNGKPKWRPSIFMPRWASRITLEIVSVRVERLQDISEADAKAEGIPDPDPEMDYDMRKKYDTIMRDGGGSHHQTGFRMLWDSLNQKRGFGWDKNPWVWVIAFNRTQREAK